jgi:hypothetical protein
MEADLIIQNAIEQLENHTGIKAHVDQKAIEEVDGRLHFIYNGKTYIAFIEVKKELRNHQLPVLEKLKTDYHPLMVIAEYIFPKIKEELRKQDIAYLETNGNIYFKDKDILLCLYGQKAVTIIKQKNGRAFTKTGLKVVFHFLLDEDLLNLTYREIATKTGVGFGNINIIMTDLKEQGFLLKIDNQHYRLNNKKELLNRWMEAYEEKLKPALFIGTFRFLKNEDFLKWQKLPLKNRKTWWGGEPAADLLTNYLKPGDFTLYTVEKKQELIKNYRLIPDEKGNVKAYQKFWNLDEANDNIAPPLLVYIDLINTGGRRCIETAQKIYDEFLQNKF